MEQKNLDYLKKQLKYSGFGEGINAQLEEKILERKENFSLIHQVNYGNDVMAAILHFSKSKETDNYFFNAYDALLKKGDRNIKQSFYVDKGNTITLKEAYNLLAGRAINKDLTNKEGAAYNAWMQLNFKQTNERGNYQTEQFHQQYGYDLKIALSKYPIKEMEHADDAQILIASLKKGNRQCVTFMQDGKEVRQFIEANPKFFNIAVYDSTMQRVFLQPERKVESEVAETVSEDEKSGEKKTVKAEIEDTKESAATETMKKRKRVSIN